MDKKFKKNILKGSLATSLGTVSGMVFQFLTIMLIVRYVSKDEMGIYSLILIVSNMFSLIAGLGLDLTMVKSIASSNERENKDVLVPVLILRGISALLFSGIFIFTGKYILHFFDDRISQFLFYIPIMFVLENFRGLFYNLLQGLKYFRQYSIVNVSSSFFRIFVVLIFIYFDKMDIEALLIIEILATIQPLVHQIFVIPFKKYLNTNITLETFKSIIKFSLPLYLNNLFVFINGRVNILIIGFFLKPADVASYSVATKVPVALKKVFSSFIIVYFPNLSKLFSEGDNETAAKFINRSLGIFSLVMTSLVLISFIFKNEIITLLYSDLYLDTALVAALLILNFHIRGIADLMGYSFTPAGHPSIPAKVNFVSSIISVVTSLILIPSLGIIGAAFSLLIMNGVSSVMYYKYLVKYDIKPALNELIRPLVLLAIIIGGYYSIGLEAIIIQIGFTIAFFVLSWFFIKDVRMFYIAAKRQLSKLIAHRV
ncbi:MAG: flippase [Calditrichae bacterium]|nr:flippase [Calditrichia bacterium]